MRWGASRARTGLGPILALLALVWLAPGVAHAAPLGLTAGKPDITVGMLSVTYDAATDAFTATTSTAFFAYFDAASAMHTVNGGATLTLTATISDLGGLSAGSLSIVGGIADLGIANGTTLLAGSFTQFGFSPDPNPAGGTSGVFEFLLNVSQSPAGLGFGPNAGVSLHFNSGLPAGWGFTTSFSNTSGAGSLDAFNVPEPATLALLLGGLGVVAAAARRRRRE